MKTKVGLAVSLVFSAGILWGGEPVPEAMVDGLASDDFGKREASQAELLQWARKQRHGAAAEILKLSRANDDPEVRERSHEILRELSDEDYLSDGQGYLGINMQEEMLEAGPEGKLRTGIRVMDVMKGSPADGAGLKQGDVIAALNGQGWTAVGAVNLFSETIGGMKPLVEVSLMVKRAAPEPVEIELKVKLGKRPIPDLREARGSLLLLDEQARERHFRDWLKALERDR